jgi:galactose mutarotase-like enzyme
MKLPFSFEILEEYFINANEKRLEITTSIRNRFKKPFCYALGRHPAFISNSENYMDCAFYDSNGKEVITLAKLMELSKTRAYIMHGEKSVIAYDNRSKKGVHLWTDFGNIMLWSPKENMFCMEPITDRVGNNDIELDLSRKGSYRDVLYSGDTKKYHTMIMVADKRI